MTEEKKPEVYLPYIERVNKAKEEGQKKAFQKHNINKVAKLSEEQVRFCEATIELKDSTAYKKLQEFASGLIVDAMRGAFHVKQLDEAGKGDRKTFGESMAYNEGYYHGLLKLKSDVDRMWLAYLTSLQDKNEVAS